MTVEKFNWSQVKWEPLIKTDSDLPFILHWYWISAGIFAAINETYIRKKMYQIDAGLYPRINKKGYTGQIKNWLKYLEYNKMVAVAVSPEVSHKF